MPETQPTVPDTQEIPAKRYFTIGEVAELCDLKAHVLRYWEQEFPQLSPVKRRGNRRYYQRDDVILIRHIRELLYAQGFTIQGARQQLEKKPKGIAQPQPTSLLSEVPSKANKTPVVQTIPGDAVESKEAQIQAIRLQLQTARALLKH